MIISGVPKANPMGDGLFFYVNTNIIIRISQEVKIY